MPILIAVIDFLVVLLLLRLLIRPNEAFFHPIYGIIYRITDVILTPSRYITRTPLQGVLLTVLVLVALRGALYVVGSTAPLTQGIGKSIIDLVRFLFQAYMVMWVISVSSGGRFGSTMVHIIARAFLPIDSALMRLGIPRRHFHVGAFFFLLILFTVLVVAIDALLVNAIVPSVRSVLIGFIIGLSLVVKLFPWPGFFCIVIIAGALLSWVSPDPSNPVVQAIYVISEPLLRPFRRLLPNLGGLDFSPIVALLAFNFIGGILLQVLVELSRRI